MTPPKGLEAGDLVRYKTEVELPQRQRYSSETKMRLICFADSSRSSLPGQRIPRQTFLGQMLQHHFNNSCKRSVRLCYMMILVSLQLQDLGLGKQSLALKQAFEAKVCGLFNLPLP